MKTSWMLGRQFSVLTLSGLFVLGACGDGGPGPTGLDVPSQPTSADTPADLMLVGGIVATNSVVAGAVPERMGQCFTRITLPGRDAPRKFRIARRTIRFSDEAQSGAADLSGDVTYMLVSEESGETIASARCRIPYSETALEEFKVAMGHYERIGEQVHSVVELSPSGVLGGGPASGPSGPARVLSGVCDESGICSIDDLIVSVEGCTIFGMTRNEAGQCTCDNGGGGEPPAVGPNGLVPDPGFGICADYGYSGSSFEYEWECTEEFAEYFDDCEGGEGGGSGSGGAIGGADAAALYGLAQSGSRQGQTLVTQLPVDTIQWACDVINSGTPTDEQLRNWEGLMIACAARTLTGPQATAVQLAINEIRNLGGVCEDIADGLSAMFNANPSMIQSFRDSDLPPFGNLVTTGAANRTPPGGSTSDRFVILHEDYLNNPQQVFTTVLTHDPDNTGNPVPVLDQNGDEIVVHHTLQHLLAHEGGHAVETEHPGYGAHAPIVSSNFPSLTTNNLSTIHTAQCGGGGPGD